MKEIKNVKLFSNRVWIAEEQADADALICKIVICDFSVNKNGVLLNRDTISEWMESLLNAPLVGKIKAKSNGEIDFTSHNATLVTRVDEDGNEYTDIELNTDAFGTFTAVEIDTIDGVECIVATARVWKRFYDASNLIVKRIKEGTLSTSWEISVDSSEKRIMNGSLVKVINLGRFIGHALLSSQTAPAYDISRVLEVAAQTDDEELYSALVRDVLKLDAKENEVEKLDKEQILDIATDEVAIDIAEVTPEEAAEPASQIDPVVSDAEEPAEPERAEMTMRDLRWKIEEALYKFADKYLDVVFIFPESHTGWAHDWAENETDMHEFSYSVENDEVSILSVNAVTLLVAPRNINSALNEKNTALIEAQKQIDALTAQVEVLEPFKAAAEQAAIAEAEAKRQADIADLRAYAEESKMLTKDELASGEIAEMIESLKVSEIKAIISDRIVAKNKKVTETASAPKQPKPRIDISSSETVTDRASIFKKFIHS